MKVIATDITEESIQEYDFSVLKLHQSIDFPKLQNVTEIWLFEEDFMDLLSYRTHDTKELIYFDIPDYSFALHVPPIWEVGKKKRIFFAGKIFNALNVAGVVNSIL